MEPCELARARGAACRLVGRLLADRPEGARLREAASLLGVAAADPDELAAAHHALFHLELTPLAGAWLHPEGLAGGAAADAAERDMHASGHHPDLASVSADHLGVLAGWLGVLLEAEAAAGSGQEARAWQRLAIDRHLLPWLPPFLGAVAATGTGFWQDLVGLLTELIADVRAERGPALAAPPSLPEPPDGLLDDPETGLARIGRFLATPVLSGLGWTATELAGVVRRTGVPAGFGGRRARLVGLLEGAARHDAVGEVVGELRGVVARRVVHLEGLDRAVWGAAPDPWRERLARTDALLARLGRA